MTAKLASEVRKQVKDGKNTQNWTNKQKTKEFESLSEQIQKEY